MPALPIIESCFDKELGKIVFLLSQGKQIRIKISASAISVYVPGKRYLTKARDFLSENKSVIVSKQNKLKSRTPSGNSVYDGMKTLFFTVRLIEDKERKNLFFKRNNDILEIYYPDNTSVNAIQPQLIRGLSYFLRKDATAYLPQRLELLAKKHDFTYNKVSIRSKHTSWGSCTSKKHISLSLYLLLAPEPLIDYVLLHELCHTIEMNHGPRFQALLNQCTNGQSQTLKQELKKIRIPT